MFWLPDALYHASRGEWHLAQLEHGQPVRTARINWWAGVSITEIRVYTLLRNLSGAEKTGPGKGGQDAWACLHEGGEKHGNSRNLQQVCMSHVERSNMDCPLPLVSVLSCFWRGAQGYLEAKSQRMSHDLDSESDSDLLDGSWCYWDHSVRYFAWMVSLPF